jgi:hypothetical protein
VRPLILAGVLLPLVLLGCRRQVVHARGQGTDSLLDSLVAVAKCPAPLPRIEVSPAFVSSEEVCALIQAAKRRLGREAPNLPDWQPEDSGAVAAVGIFAMTEGLMDTTGVSSLRHDSILSVELDIPARPRLLRVMYDRVTHEETFRAVHR